MQRKVKGIAICVSQKYLSYIVFTRGANDFVFGDLNYNG
jgi:hypothetical protein